MMDTRYRDDPAYRIREGTRMRERYRNDPEYREKTKRAARERYHNDYEYHQKALERARGKSAKYRVIAPGKYCCPSCHSIMGMTDDGLGVFCNNSWCIMGLTVISIVQLGAME
jgi:hypothetical protein